MLGRVAGLVRAVIGSRELDGPGWRLTAERPVERADVFDSIDIEGGWGAVLGIRRGLKLLVSGDDTPGLEVEAWAGEPADSSDGVAVVELAGRGLAVARVPLCGCGTRGCGNAGIQLRKQLPAGELPALIAVLRELPWTKTRPTRSNVLRGDELAALPVPRDLGSGPWTVVYHGGRMREKRLASP